MWHKPWQQKQQVYSAASCFLAPCAPIQPEPLGCASILLSGWAAVQFTLVAFQRKNLSLENALGSFTGGTRAFTSPWKSQWGHSENQVHVTGAAPAPRAQKLLRVTLLHSVAHLDLPTDRKEHLGLRASPLTEELSHCKIKATLCPQDRGNLEISGL